MSVIAWTWGRDGAGGRGPRGEPGAGGVGGCGARRRRQGLRRAGGLGEPLLHRHDLVDASDDTFDLISCGIGARGRNLSPPAHVPTRNSTRRSR